MKTNKKFLGIIMALGLTFSLALGASAATALPSTDSVNIQYDGQKLEPKNREHFFKKSGLKDAVALYTIFDRALKKSGKQNDELIYEGLMMETLSIYGYFNKNQEKAVCLGPKVPGNMIIKLSDDSSKAYEGLNLKEMKNKMKELNKQNSDFIKVLNQEKNKTLTQEEFNETIEKIKKQLKDSIDKKHYHDEEEKQSRQNTLKKIGNVKFEDVKGKISKFVFGVQKGPEMKEEELVEINKGLQKQPN